MPQNRKKTKKKSVSKKNNDEGAVGAGRPSVFKDERVRNTILAALKMGLSRDDACYLAGINPITFYKFFERIEESIAANKKIPETFVQFFNDVKKARSELKVRLLRKIDEAAERNWQAAAWRLERGFPDEFGRKFNETKITVDKNSDKVVVEIKIPEELKLE